MTACQVVCALCAVLIVVMMVDCCCLSLCLSVHAPYDLHCQGGGVRVGCNTVYLLRFLACMWVVVSPSSSFPAYECVTLLLRVVARGGRYVWARGRGGWAGCVKGCSL